MYDYLITHAAYLNAIQACEDTRILLGVQKEILLENVSKLKAGNEGETVTSFGNTMETLVEMGAYASAVSKLEGMQTILKEELPKVNMLLKYAGKELAVKLDVEGYKILKVEDSTIANADWYDMGFDKPPIAEKTMVYTVEAGDYSYSRVFLEGYNNPVSTFIIRTDEIAGLNAQEIAEKLALPKVPNRIVEVELPPSTPIEVSITGPQPDWGTVDGNIQFAIKDVDLNPQWFIDIRILE